MKRRHAQTTPSKRGDSIQDLAAGATVAAGQNGPGAPATANPRRPFDFAGTDTGEFAGIAATDRKVRVPYSVIYDLRGGQISALRIYFPMSQLMQELTS
jgi:hypothetical protein